MVDDKTKLVHSSDYAFDNASDADLVPGSPGRPAVSEPLQSIMNRAMSRRAMLKGVGAAGATMVVTPTLLLKSDPASAGHGHKAGIDPSRRLTFETIAPGDGSEPDVRVPPNYEFDVILRWGDPLFPEAPAFDVNDQTGDSQAQQFGFNADLVLWNPLPNFVRRSLLLRGDLNPIAERALGIFYPRIKNRHSRRALVIVNHEYTTGADMFPDYDDSDPTQDQVETEIEAHGFSIVELALDRRRRWRFERSSPFNRRITGSTPMEITGPLRGHDMMKTSQDPDGVEVLGSLNNCAGGKTPWGTYLTCEENFDQYFANFGSVPEDIRTLSERVAAVDGATTRRWENYATDDAGISRFDLAQEPTEYNRFGYIVEIDPYDPNDKPKKRTALGRFKHEGAAARVAANGQVAIYSGDDARFEYVFKFVTKGRYRPHDRIHNKKLLDEGTLYVARFDAGDTAGDEMGNGLWLPLVWEPGNALDQAGFQSQAEVLLDTRGAADVLGATPMDRPEDIEVNPISGNVYIALTNNSRRDGSIGDERVVNGRIVSSAPNEANPRNDTYDDGDPASNTGNQHGHIIELIEDDGDAAAISFTWNIFIKCGDPQVPEHDTSFGDMADPVGAGVSPISDPDNLVHDNAGNLWIATDGMPFSGSAIGFGQNDGVFAVPVVGESRGLLRQFLSGVPGGEICGPEFSGDNRTFFCAIQHPHDGEAFEKLWPLDETVVTKPSLIGVYEIHGRKIGR